MKKTTSKRKTKQKTTTALKRQLVMFLCIMILLTVAWGAIGVKTVGGNDVQVSIVVAPGTSTTQIATELKEKGLIKNELLFSLVAKLKGVDGKLKAGDYTFAGNMSIEQIIERLITGNVTYTVLMIPEGYTVAQIADKVERMGLGSKTDFLAAAATGQFDFPYIQGLAATPKRLEGFLFPDTYRIPRGASEQEIIKIMLQRFNSVYTPEMVQRAQAMGLPVNKVITMASIIEREAKVESERAVIASVFYNRLHANMQLQSCATVQYALGQHKDRLYYKDLAVNSPYNTYKNIGLPPGPIANPGKAAIKAALYPANTDYLYFVTKNDQTHIFSRTYAEHLAAQKNADKERAS